MTGDVRLRSVEDSDLDLFYEHQADPVGSAMAAFPVRERDEFLRHWARIRADETVVTRTIVADGEVAGNIGSWQQDGHRWVGYWIGREHWGRGIATRALALLLDVVPDRPFYAHVVAHNVGSIRVLEKCGFQREGGEPVTDPDGVVEFTFVLRG